MTDPLTPVSEVIAAVERAVHPTPPAEILLERCWRSVLAADVLAPMALPPHDNSAMDGFAVRAEDTADASESEPVVLRVVGRSHAGAPPVVPCAPGDAVEIATGAMLPAGADAIVRLEEARFDGDRVTVTAPVHPGRDVRWRGEDIGAGERLLQAGQQLGMIQLAAAASVGLRSLPVHRPAHVSVVLTGDEVVRGDILDPGKVPDALSSALVAAIRADGAEAAVTGPVGDDDERLVTTLTAAADASDLIITTGGVSVGPRDRMPAVLARLGNVERWKVAVKPGKPFALAQVDGVPVICLPGNPVAALVAYELFARAALGQLAGRPFRSRSWQVRLAGTLVGDRARLHLVRGRLGARVGGPLVMPVWGSGAGSIASIGTADVWIVLPPGTAELTDGALVEVRPMAGT